MDKTDFNILEYIEAGLRSQGLDQKYIDAAKQQIEKEIAFNKMSRGDRDAYLKRVELQKYGVRKSADSIPMPSQEDINKMYVKRVHGEGIQDETILTILDALYKDEQTKEELKNLKEVEAKRSFFRKAWDFLAFWRK
jgi:tmRNA-binding protein